jgi:hypothetical protein
MTRNTKIRTVKVTKAKTGKKRQVEYLTWEKASMMEPATRQVRVNIPTDVYNTIERLMKDRGSTVHKWIELQLIALSRSTGLIRLKDKMPFGKYNGATVEDVVRCDPKYIEWLLTNSTTARFDFEVNELVAEVQGYEASPDIWDGVEPLHMPE